MNATDILSRTTVSKQVILIKNVFFEGLQLDVKGVFSFWALCSALQAYLTAGVTGLWATQTCLANCFSQLWEAALNKKENDNYCICKCTQNEDNLEFFAAALNWIPHRIYCKWNPNISNMQKARHKLCIRTYNGNNGPLIFRFPIGAPVTFWQGHNPAPGPLW